MWNKLCPFTDHLRYKVHVHIQRIFVEQTELLLLQNPKGKKASEVWVLTTPAVQTLIPYCIEVRDLRAQEFIK